MIGITLRLAWRNVWRNPRRTLITCSAIGIGFALLLLGMAFSRGWQAQLAAIMTESWIGDAQIHAPGYREAPDVERALQGVGGHLERVRATTGVGAASARVIAPAMVAIGDRSSGVRLIGGW